MEAACSGDVWAGIANLRNAVSQAQLLDWKLPANQKKDGLAVSNAKQYSFFVRV
jgi:hypothetical protein